MMDLVKKIATLPGVIYFEDCIFELRFSCNGGQIRLFYLLTYVYSYSQHHNFFLLHGVWYNPFYNKQRNDFLYTYDGIEDEESMHEAIDNCHKFLQRYNFEKP